MKNNIPIFEWDEEQGLATCILTNGEDVYYGFAYCHPEDEDMKGEKTGCEIALKRAEIEALKGYRDKLKIRLETLNHLHSIMKRSKHFNPKSYENKMLHRQIRMINFDLATVKEMIATEKQSLKTYIDEKDNFYVKTRKRRTERSKVNNI